MQKQPGQTCVYCGSRNAPGDVACVSCGARASDATAEPVVVSHTPERQNPIVGVGVWLFLGLFGGYAYWSGNPLRACARVTLWITLVSTVTLAGAAERAAGAPSPPLVLFLFAGSVLTIFMLWVFDLVHLVRRWGYPAHTA